MRKYRCGHGFAAPFMFHGGWRWHGGFPRRKDYLEMLEAYKEELEAMQSHLAEEIKDIEREIEELS
jgi:hypothetical protein